MLLVIDLAPDISVETRIRQAIDTHLEAGIIPRTVVINFKTMEALVQEMEGITYDNTYFWMASMGKGSYNFLGLPILVKDFIPDREVVIGV